MLESVVKIGVNAAYNYARNVRKLYSLGFKQILDGKIIFVAGLMRGRR